MELKAAWIERTLRPSFPLGTSKGPISERTVWYLVAWDPQRPQIKGIGEAAHFPGHSVEFPAEIRTKLVELCAETRSWEDRLEQDLVRVPSVRFAVEQCLRDFSVGGTKQLFPSTFTLGQRGIPINGLVWMGSKETMRQRIRERTAEGFTCVKLKIGALGIEHELDLLRELRKDHPASEVQLRVDANGAFQARDAPRVLDALAELDVHSIEQPVAPGAYEMMAELCATSPVPIALDEDLIGMLSTDAKKDLLDHVAPRYIVIKPSLVGGWRSSEEWIQLATERGIGWWITSALESNIGLNAIAQWVATLPIAMPQGLGTGQVYENNVGSPLEVADAMLWYRPEREWDLADLSP
ncbi:MAG: o-succinylbenzoate synthase [Flavobacteriales bacterium]|nr:o-succinylbenzoate synthase [Flavobacteriales bacterium]